MNRREFLRRTTSAAAKKAISLPDLSSETTPQIVSQSAPSKMEKATSLLRAGLKFAAKPGIDGPPINNIFNNLRSGTDCMHSASLPQRLAAHEHFAEVALSARLLTAEDIETLLKLSELLEESTLQFKDSDIGCKTVKLITKDPELVNLEEFINSLSEMQITRQMAKGFQPNGSIENCCHHVIDNLLSAVRSFNESLEDNLKHADNLNKNNPNCSKFIGAILDRLKDFKNVPTTLGYNPKIQTHSDYYIALNKLYKHAISRPTYVKELKSVLENFLDKKDALSRYNLKPDDELEEFVDELLKEHNLCIGPQLALTNPFQELAMLARKHNVTITGNLEPKTGHLLFAFIQKDEQLPEFLPEHLLDSLKPHFARQKLKAEPSCDFLDFEKEIPEGSSAKAIENAFTNSTSKSCTGEILCIAGIAIVTLKLKQTPKYREKQTIAA